MNNNKALTLIEVIVAAIILALLMLGLTNLFVSGKRYIMHARSRMTGGEIGRLFLEPLNMAVRQGDSSSTAADGWGHANNGLMGGVSYCGGAGAPQRADCPTQRTLNNVTYDAVYTISSNSPISNLTRVKLDVNWTEP